MQVTASTTTNIVEKVNLGAINRVTWGRRGKAGWNAFIGAALIIPWCPLWMLLNLVALQDCGGSLTKATKLLISEGLFPYLCDRFPLPTKLAVSYYLAWLTLQALLFTFLPGRRCTGQRTPGGHLLQYTTNGLLAWFITHVVATMAVYTGQLDPAVVARNWNGLLATVNLYGFFLGVALLCKGYWAPSFSGDRKLTGSWLFDFCFGIELNPRIGSTWDLKFFHNSRPGIVAWTLIDLSWAAYQGQTLGYVTYSIMVVTILHAIYVIDFFHNEDWYTRTIDITHDHLGFLLAWGDVMFLPAFYTLQTQYLARYPTHPTLLTASAILGLGLAGYAVFRSANHQKDHVRRLDGKTNVWGRPAQFIRCTYRTDDGKTHSSILLTSGWWGLCRHPNYVADLVMATAMCLPCGFAHILPWSYLIFMSTLLYTRAQRDDRRCRNKYGEKWTEYCRRVPYQFIPGVL